MSILSESESEVAQSCWTLCDAMDCSYQAPPSMGFSRQEYWSGLPFPSPGDLPYPGIEPGSPAFQADALTFEPQGKQCGRFWFNSWVKKIPWKRDRLTSPVFLGFPRGSAGKESACNARDLSSIPGLGRSPGKGKGSPVRYLGLETSMDIVHGVTKSRTCLSNFHFI